MSEFIGELSNKVGKVPMSQILSDLYSLGENARRMLDIGIAQDELVKLCFGPSSYGDNIDESEYRNNQCKYDFIMVVFGVLSAEVIVEEHLHSRDPETFEFTYVDGWKVNLIQKIKELINEKVS